MKIRRPFYGPAENMQVPLHDIIAVFQLLLGLRRLRFSFHELLADQVDQGDTILISVENEALTAGALKQA